MAADTKVIFSGTRRSIHRLVYFATAAGDEAAVTKVDKSTLTGPTGSEPTKLGLKELKWDLSGINYVNLMSSDSVIETLSGQGHNVYDPPLYATNNGDFEITTQGHAAGGSYTITLTAWHNG